MNDGIRLDIRADGKQLTEEQISSISALVYIDNDDEHADDLQMVVQDPGDFEGKGRLEVTIINSRRNDRNKSAALRCGTFHIDDSRESEMEGIYVIKAAAVTAASCVRQDAKCQAWERINLKELAREIAERNGLDLIYASDFNPTYARKEQLFVSDIKFLSDACRLKGLSLKFADNTIIVYSRHEHGATSPARVFKKNDSEIRDIMLHHRKNDTAYGRCQAEYYDPVKKERIAGEYIEKKDGRTLQINRKVSSTDEARMLAKLGLLEKNSKEYTGTIECDGDIMLATGETIELSGWGEYDRNYIIRKAAHIIQGTVYTTKIFFEAGSPLALDNG